jgi:hypothetical protein
MCIRCVIFLHQVCITIPLAEHKVCTKCARYRLCRLGAHSTQPVTRFLGWLVQLGWPSHGPRADVVEPAAGARLPVLVAFSQRKELPLAASQRIRNGAVVPCGDERQPSQDGGDWHNVDDRLLRLIQLLRRTRFVPLTPAGGESGDSPVHWRNEDQLKSCAQCRGC